MALVYPFGKKEYSKPIENINKKRKKPNVGGGINTLVPPNGFQFILGLDGNYLLGKDGAYLYGKI